MIGQLDHSDRLSSRGLMKGLTVIQALLSFYRAVRHITQGGHHRHAGKSIKQIIVGRDEEG